MRKFFMLFLALSFIPFIQTSAFATDGIYVGHGLGGASFTNQNTITIAANNTTAQFSSTNASLIGELLAGYSLAVNEHFGLALEFDAYIYDGSTEPVDFRNNTLSANIQEKAPYGLTIAALPEWRITPISRLLLKVGYTRGYFELTTTSGSVTRKKEAWRDAFNVGVGTQIAVTDSADLRFMGSVNLYGENQFNTRSAFTTLKVEDMQAQLIMSLIWHTDLLG